MKLATLNDGSRDGGLIVVSRDGKTFVSAADIAPNLQAALDDWTVAGPRLDARYQALLAGDHVGEPLDEAQLHSPLPRAYEWIDGSAFLNHVILVRKARNAEPPATLTTDPLVYQGGSGTFLGPRQDIPLHNEDWGLDFEAEVVVVLNDTPLGTKAADALAHVKLIMLVNDITLRTLIPTELKKGFGFFNGKPSSAFSPFAVTPDELGEAWSGGRLDLVMTNTLNGEVVGQVRAGPEMHFSFAQLIEHVCKTRSLTAGTILGSGTISNEDRSAGISCLAERRMIEIIDTGAATTPFMKPGDTIRIEMFNHDGDSVFGTIEQTVVPA